MRKWIVYRRATEKGLASVKIDGAYGSVENRGSLRKTVWVVVSGHACDENGIPIQSDYLDVFAPLETDLEGAISGLGGSFVATLAFGGAFYVLMYVPSGSKFEESIGSVIRAAAERSREGTERQIALVLSKGTDDPAWAAYEKWLPTSTEQVLYLEECP
jgi:hypothetical protein